MSAEPIGVYSDILARQSRMRAVAARRGMSESALARLPKPARFDPILDLAPVLATRRDGTNYAQQTRARDHALARVRGIGGSWSPGRLNVLEIEVALPKPVSFRVTPSGDLQRAKAIVAMVAALCSVEAWQLTGPSRQRRFVVPRKLCVRALYEFLRMAQGRIADVFDADFQTVRYHLKHSEWLCANDAKFSAMYGAARALIIERWPEYRA